MAPEDQDRVAVVLVRARNPSNIGAAARAMHDLGFGDLRVVNEFPVPFEAAKSAVDASSVLLAAREEPTLGAAIADCTLVLGTTAVGERALEHPLYVLAEAVQHVARTLAHDPHSRVALLFGSEKTGLSNEELSHCHALLTIPMNTRPHAEDAVRHLSMNLGQAVAVCLYALREGGPVAQVGGAPAKAAAIAEDRATAGDLERLSSLLSEIFHANGYERRHPANAREPSVRRMVRRMGLSASDAAVWTGILRQMLHTAAPGKTRRGSGSSGSGRNKEQDAAQPDEANL